MNWQTVLEALAIAVPSFVIAVLAYRRSRQVDLVAERSGVAANGRAGTAQIIEGLNALVDQLQEEVSRLRAHNGVKGDE